MKALVVGCGELGWRLAQLLATDSPFTEITVADVNPAGAGRANITGFAASLMGRPSRVHFKQADALDPKSCLSLFEETRFDLVANTASLQSWHVIQGLPKDLWERIHSAGLGPWLPVHLAPAFGVMRAIQQSGQAPRTLNMAFPDASNIALSRIGLAPDIGAGNIEELVPPLASAVAARLNVDIDRIQVKLVGHHWVNAAILESELFDGLPIMYELCLDGERLDESIDFPSLLSHVSQQFPPGHEDTWLIAASAWTKVVALMGYLDFSGHAVAPIGLPGGYPVQIHNGQIKLDLPPDMSLNDCVRTNEAGARLDGIAEITEDGTVVLTSDAVEIIDDAMGWRLESFSPEQTLQLGPALVNHYRDFVSRLNR